MKNLDNLKITITIALFISVMGITAAQRPENVRIDTSTTTVENPTTKTQTTEPTANNERSKAGSRTKTRVPDYRTQYPKTERAQYPQTERTNNPNGDVTYKEGCKKDNGQIGNKDRNRQYDKSKSTSSLGGFRNKSTKKC